MKKDVTMVTLAPKLRGASYVHSSTIVNFRAALVALALACCARCGGTSTEPERPGDKRDWIAAPPRPGSSITHTKLCECLSCQPRSCCQGETGDAPQKQCGDSYDFSDEACGLSVESCTSRCTKHVWRVPSAATCANLPPACCESCP